MEDGSYELTSDEVAAVLQISARHVRDLGRRGVLSRRWAPGHRHLYSERQVREVKASGTVRPSRRLRGPGPRTHPVMRTLWGVRQRRGLSLTELARLSGIREATIRRWETGETQPRMLDVERLCAALNMRFRWAVEARVPRGTVRSSRP